MEALEAVGKDTLTTVNDKAAGLGSPQSERNEALQRPLDRYASHVYSIK